MSYMPLYRKEGASAACAARLFRQSLAGATRRFEITVGVARIVVVVGKRVAVDEEEFNALNRNGKTEAFTKRDFHISHANDFTTHIEKRATAVAGIDLRGRLQVQIALEL